MEPRPDHQINLFELAIDAHRRSGLDFSKIDLSDSSSVSGLLGMEIKCPSVAEVRRESKTRVHEIFSSYDTLREILVRHEATIRKRWAKKSKQQRLKILTNAWPGMAAVHRPDFDVLRKELLRLQTMETQHREVFIWPYINQEDLSQPNALPMLLNARGRHHPSEFSAADNSAMHMGLIGKAIVPIFLNEYTMIMNGVTTPQDYGKLVSWKENPNAFNWLHTRRQYVPGEGLLVLEAQERLQIFLVDCCKQILHDIPADTLTSDAFPVEPEPKLLSRGPSTGFHSLTVMAAEAPYRVPAHLDLGRIVSLLDARTSAAEDHLWALREDPNYFAEQLRDAKEHRLEMIRDTENNIHPILKRGRETRLWARVIGNVVFNAYLELETFAQLRQQAQDLQRLQEKYRADIIPTKDLPEEYLFAILKFSYYVSQAAGGPIDQLRNETPASPPMAKFYVRQPPVNPTSSRIIFFLRRGVRMDKIEMQLIWALKTIWADGQALFLAGLPLILDELERLLQAEKKASELISGHVAAVIGDLSIISQCTNQLNLYLPWARAFESAQLERSDKIKQDFAEVTGPWAKIMAALKDTNLMHIAKIGDPSDKKFYYPLEKRRTKENTEALRKAENNLDNVWASVDRLIYSECGNLEGTALRKLLSQPRILQRTSEWVDEAPRVPKEQNKVLDHGARYKPLSTLYFGLPDTTINKPEDERKVKTKTKGTPQELPGTAINENTDGNNQRDDHPTSIPVDARSMKVFRTLFFNPEVTSTPGEIPWNDFLHAMTSTGLFSAEKLYGSVWQFQKSDGVGRIQFHEPHPRSRIPFTVARRYGRRLSRAFGWESEMFTLKQKANE